MPKVSKDSAPQRQRLVRSMDLRGELDGYTVSFTTLVSFSPSEELRTAEAVMMKNCRRCSRAQRLGTRKSGYG